MRKHLPPLFIFPIFALSMAFGYASHAPTVGAQAPASMAPIAQAPPIQPADIAPAVECEGCELKKHDNPGGGVTFVFTSGAGHKAGECKPKDGGGCETETPCKIRGLFTATNTSANRYLLHYGPGTAVELGAGESVTLMLIVDAQCGENQTMLVTGIGQGTVASFQFECTKCKPKKKDKATVQPPRDG